MKADTRGRGHLSEDIVIVESNFVVSSLGGFVGVRKARTETAFWITFRSRLQLKRANGRHYQKITEIAVARSAEMRVRKSDDLDIVVIVAGTVFISIFVVFSADIVWLLVRVGRKLNRAEWNRSSGIRMAHLLRTDQWVDVFDVVFTNLRKQTGVKNSDDDENEYFFHFKGSGLARLSPN